MSDNSALIATLGIPDSPEVPDLPVDEQTTPTAAKTPAQHQEQQRLTLTPTEKTGSAEAEAARVADSDDESGGESVTENTPQNPQPDFVETTSFGKTNGPDNETQSEKAAAAHDRYAHVKELLGGNPEMKLWVQNLANQLKQRYYFVSDDFLERELSVKLAVEVRKAWRDGRLQSGKLGGGRTGQNTKYTLSDIRGDKVRFLRTYGSMNCNAQAFY